MPDISEKFEARSTEQDSAGVKRHLSAVVAKIIGTEARRQGIDDSSGRSRRFPIPNTPTRPSTRSGFPQLERLPRAFQQVQGGGRSDPFCHGPEALRGDLGVGITRQRGARLS